MSFDVLEQIAALGKAMTAKAKMIGVRIDVAVNGEPMKFAPATKMRKPHVRCDPKDVDEDKRCLTEILRVVKAGGGTRRDVVLQFRSQRQNTANVFYRRLNALPVEFQQLYNALPVTPGGEVHAMEPQ